jgi:acetylornithine/N-succinyldiaminopimelate aminotransferase
MSGSAVSRRPTAVLPAYDRANVTFERGEGCWLVADDGKRYLDFVAGIAVIALGHLHPTVTAAAHEQLDRLWHASNLYWTEPMIGLAERLSARFGGAQAFFCNSGTEAVEAALKYSRKATGRSRLVALEGSFHGRSFGSLSVTGQPAKRTAFEPLVPGVVFARLNDADSLREACADEPPACILIEPVQGEGGIRPATPEFVAAAAALAEETGALLVFDEIQAGVGRTGTFFAYEQLGDVRPSLVTMAKGLANGLPIGCLLVADEAAGAFRHGDHASTFGGSPVPCAAACAVLDAIDDDLLAGVQAAGVRLAEELRAMPRVQEVRGLGLMLGAELDGPAADVVAACLERRLLVSSAGERVLRLTPPLTVSPAEVDEALGILRDALS